MLSKRGVQRGVALVGPALITMALSVVVAARRPMWLDEGATIWTSRLPWDDFVAFVTESRDAVHAVYYVLVRACVSISGTDLLLWRVPSILGMGLACLAVTLIGRTLGSPRLGMLSGLAFALLPVVWEYGAEARSVALATATISWASYVLARLIVAATGRLWWMWILYSALITVAGYLFVYAWLVALAHVLTVLLSPDLRRRLAPRLAAALAASVVLLVPLATLAYDQREQVSWIQMDTLLAIRAMAAYMLGQRTLHTYVAAAALWALVLWGTVVLLRSSQPAETRRRLLVLGWAWATVPGLVLVLVSLWQPTFWDRYVTVSAPAVALLLGISLDVMSRRWRVVAAVAIVGVSAAMLVSTDWTAGRDHWRDKRAVLSAHASKGDAVLASPRSYELVTRFAGLPADLLHVRTADSRPPAASWPAAATVPLESRPATVWLVPFSLPRPQDAELLARLGYALADEYAIDYFDGRQSSVQKWVQPE